MGNTKDISTNLFSYEVKSTLDCYSTQVTISSKFQLDPHEKPIKLSFVRFEPSVSGDYFGKVIDRLEQLGCNKTKLLRLLARRGVVPGNQAFNSYYNMLEMRIADVDDSFPVKKNADFVSEHMPQHVVHFIYTIDRAGIPYHTID